jgi:hypothetical protein
LFNAAFVGVDALVRANRRAEPWLPLPADEQISRKAAHASTVPDHVRKSFAVNTSPVTAFR